MLRATRGDRAEARARPETDLARRRMRNEPARSGCWSALARVLLRLATLPLLAFCAAALWFDGTASRGLAGALAAGFVLVSLALLLRRPARRNLLLALVPSAAVLAWWFSLQPRNDRVWQPDVERPPNCSFDGERVTISNVRHAAWRSDTECDPHWETHEYDLSQVGGMDLFLSYWGPRAIAHTILSWEFTDGRHLAISIETRKEVGESYSAVRGFFRQYELYYVVADERDVIRVRTDFRGEDVYLYRLRAPPDRARAILRQYLLRIDRLSREPEWYNAVDKNCTTVIFEHVRPIVGHVPFDLRMLANGHIDEMLYEQGAINASLPFETLREASRVSAAARAAGDTPDFSRAIRQNLPARPPPPPPGK